MARRVKLLHTLLKFSRSRFTRDTPVSEEVQHKDLTRKIVEADWFAGLRARKLKGWNRCAMPVAKQSEHDKRCQNCPAPGKGLLVHVRVHRHTVQALGCAPPEIASPG